MKTILLPIISLISSFSLASFLSLPFAAKGETVLEEIKRTGLLKVGVREDAAPFGYRDSSGSWAGVCLDFIEVLKQRIQKESQQNIVTVKLIKSTLFNRFELIQDRIVYLECGPNTINNALDKKVEFSRAFWVTGTQFLIREESEQNFDPYGNLQGLTIGVLRYTTTAREIAQQYPRAKLQEFQGVTGRLRGIQALQQKRIDGFASEGILLIGEAIVKNLALGRDYLLVPQPPLSCEYYGLILPQGDPQWRDFVNSTILGEEMKETYRQWFSLELLQDLQETLNFCQVKEARRR